MFRSDFPHHYLVTSLVFLLALLTSPACSSKRIITPTGSVVNTSSGLININHADRAELEKLPNIGPSLAARIVEHRERYGPFRKREHLLMIEGMSDRRFREIENLIAVN